MKNNNDLLKVLIKELLGLKEEYRDRSETIVSQMKTCAELFAKTHNVDDAKRCQKLKKEHEALSQSYQKRIALLETKISHSMEATIK